jgi:hypothetical protein
MHSQYLSGWTKDDTLVYMTIDLLIIVGITLLLYGILYARGSALVLASVLSATFSLYTAQYLFTSGILNVSPLVQKIMIAVLLLVGISSFSSVLRSRRLGYSIGKRVLGFVACALSALYIVGMYLQLLPNTLYDFSPDTAVLYATKIGFTGALFLIPFILPILLRKVD